MNHYGTMAKRHWQRFLPSRYRQISDPETFFTQLGQQVQEEITHRSEQILASQPPTSEYLRMVGRRKEAQLSAEEAVLAEMVLLPAEPGSPMDEDSGQTTPTSHDQQTNEGWIPLTEDPAHPAWQQMRELDDTR
ncbi:hypothetical protein [Prauserella muralis]|uniref:TnpV protein n=1 Tax=Prauserella muralis TaxID=588067 RepID=A0A2V4ADD2_9PSEU|nr:hypothetical protein [Prauserella muralis]PXY16594.1 hypothetical protein BAY60_35975 [Prauserella muralis]